MAKRRLTRTMVMSFLDRNPKVGMDWVNMYYRRMSRGKIPDVRPGDDIHG